MCLLAWFISCFSLVVSPYSLRSWKKVHSSNDGPLIPLIRYLANNLCYFIIAPHSISGSCLTCRPYEMWAHACSNRFSGLRNSMCYFICRSNISRLQVQHVVWALLVSVDICWFGGPTYPFPQALYVPYDILTIYVKL